MRNDKIGKMMLQLVKKQLALGVDIERFDEIYCSLPTLDLCFENLSEEDWGSTGKAYLPDKSDQWKSKGTSISIQSW